MSEKINGVRRDSFMEACKAIQRRMFNGGIKVASGFVPQKGETFEEWRNRHKLGGRK